MTSLTRCLKGRDGFTSELSHLGYQSWKTGTRSKAVVKAFMRLTQTLYSS